MKNITINGKKLSELFAKADEKIELAERARNEEERLAKEKEEKEKEKVIKCTQKIVDSIESLVYDILSTTNDKEGYITDSCLIGKELGTLSTLPGFPSKYTIDDEGLKIVLDYSSKPDSEARGGKCFMRFCPSFGSKYNYYSSSNEGLDILYLKAALLEKNIDILFCDYTDGEEEKTNIQRIKITLKREKKKTADKTPYIKK